MTAPILYLGDTSLATAASYLAGVMHHCDWSFDYVPSDVSLTDELLDPDRRLIILSDYPAERVSDGQQHVIAEKVGNGCGLLMIGGWESFQGNAGNWYGTAIADLLPVEISEDDDRQNCDCPVLLSPQQDHPILRGLSWSKRPPVIGGYNQVEKKPDATLLLSAERWPAQRSGNGHFAFSLASADPLLVVRDHHDGRVAAFMTDVAPHWVGPLVDWGAGRVTSQAPGAGEIEVGSLYVQFLQQLLSWTGRLESVT